MFTDETLAVFLDELDEKIQILDENVMLLEQEGACSEVLQEIFRAAHTIKGSSAVMGYIQIAGLTHEMESVFDLMRNGSVHVSAELIVTLFAALDTLKYMRDQIVSGNGEDTDIDTLLASLRSLQKSPEGDPRRSHTGQGVDADAGATSVAGSRGSDGSVQAGSDVGGGEGAGANHDSRGEGESTGYGDGGAGIDACMGVEGEGRDAAEGFRWSNPEMENIADLLSEIEIKGLFAYWIKVVVDPTCEMKGPRAYLIFRQLEEYGEIIQCNPSAEDLQEGRYGESFALVLITTHDKTSIHNALLTVAEISRVTIKKIERENNGAESENAMPRHSDVSEGEVACAAPPLVKEEAQSELSPKNLTKGIKKVQQINSQSANHTVRVDVRKLDTLLNLVGELVIDRTRLDRFVKIAEDRLGSGELVDSAREISSHLGQISGDLQEEIMKARMLPVAQLFNRFPRMVRDLANKLGKEINFVLEGQETELDRNVIEIITDPLIHIIRNSIDHGIEPPEQRKGAGKDSTGLLRLAASYRESHIMIVVQDDGKGMDAQHLRQVAVEKGLIDANSAGQLSEQQALELIFLPGFSSVTEVSDLSGRGVGMDIVRTQIEQINGTIELDTKAGQGTSITIKLPLTLVIIRALMVEVSERVYAFPLANVYETIKVGHADIKKVGQNNVIVVRGMVMPVLWLAEVFGEELREQKDYLIVLLGTGGKQVGVIVDRLLGEQEIVIKSLGKYIKQTGLFSGATILGDGQVALIVDTRGFGEGLA